MPKRADIIEFIKADSGLSRHKAFKHGTESWENWFTFLRTLYAIPFESDEEYQRYQHFTAREQAPTQPATEAWTCIGRRGGKSFCSAVIAVFEALTGRYAERLSGGEAAAIDIIACDKHQAKNIFRYCVGLLRVAAPKEILRSTRELIELKNGVEISIQAGNYASLRGSSLAMALIDEAAFLKDESGNYASPIQEIYKALRPALIPASGDDPAGKILFLSTPRSRTGMMFERFEKFWGKDTPSVLCWRGATLEMHPGYISQAAVDADLLDDRSHYQAEWLAIWRDDTSSIFDADKIRVAMGDHEPIPYNPSRSYIGFIDSSEGRHDSFCIAIGFRAPNGQLVVCRHEEWKAKFVPADVVKQVAALARDYHLSVLWSDAHAVGWVEDSFIKEGIRIRLSKFSKSQLYGEFQGLIQLGKCWLVNDRRAETQLLQLVRVDGRDGSYRIDHPDYGGAADDLANVLAGCAVTMFKEIRQWTEGEMEARLPQKGSHQSPPNSLLGKAVREADIRRDNFQILDEWMRAGGGSRIIR